MPPAIRRGFPLCFCIIATIVFVARESLFSPATAAERKFGQALPWQPHHYGGSHIWHSRGGGFTRGSGRHFSHGAGYGPYRSYGYSGYGYAGGWIVTPPPLCGYYPNSFYSFYSGPIVLPPVYGDASRWFGLGPIARMTQPEPQLPRPVAQVAPQIPQDDLVLVRRPKAAPPDIRVAVREANPTSLAAAEKLMGFGIEHFRQGDYSAARRRFRDAARRAPDLAEVYLRWAFTAIALNRYDEALTAVTKAIGLDESLVAEDLQLREMYADEMDCEVDRNRLAQATLDDPGNAGLLYLTAFHLHFSGAAERALPLFQSALERGMPAAYVEPFLPKPPPPRDF